MAATRFRRGRSAGKVTKNMTVREATLVLNEASTVAAQWILHRRIGAGTGMNPDPRRDIDKECGYNPCPTVQDFKELYDRFGLAARCVNLMPDECFTVWPDIYETERPRDTAFEKRVKALIAHPELCLPYHMHKADGQSGIGTYGGILIGVDDNKPPDTILDGFDEEGNFTQAPAGRNLLYLRALDETTLRVHEINENPLSRRYGLPQSYYILPRYNNNRDSSVVTVDPLNEKEGWVEVHWSRVIHVAETYGVSDETYADPRLKKLNEPLYDIRKILGGSAEMFWKGGFPGIAATVDPRFIEAGGIDVDQESISGEMQRFMEGLQRYILGVGFQINSLAPQVADPTQHLMMQFQTIAIIMQIPLRVFMGTEEAKLASGQDAKAWQAKVKRRRDTYVTPKIVRRLIDRLIGAGVIPAPKLKDEFGMPKYIVSWPDATLPDQNELSTIADRRAAAMMKYVMSGGFQLMQPSDFLRFVLGYEPMEIDQIMTNAKKGMELPFDLTKNQLNPPKGPADSGTSGNPPSDSPPGAIKG